MSPTFTTVLAADFAGEHVSVNDVGALRARAETWEATANTWRAFAVDVARVVGTEDPEDVGIEDLRGLAGAVEQLRTFALEVALQVAPLGEEQRAAQTTVRDLPAVAEALREVVAERDRADQRADRAHGYRVAAENEAAALRARAEAAEAAAAAAGDITVCDCGMGRLRLVDEDGLCVDCGCDVIVVADRHSADIVAQLRQEREAAEAALATARAAMVAEMKAREAAALGRSGAAQEGAREAGCDDWDEAGLADWGAAEALRDLAAYIDAGAHVRPVEGA
jgi:hypothetical protein